MSARRIRHALLCQGSATSVLSCWAETMEARSSAFQNQSTPVCAGKVVVGAPVPAADGNWRRVRRSRAELEAFAGARLLGDPELAAQLATNRCASGLFPPGQRDAPSCSGLRHPVTAQGAGGLFPPGQHDAPMFRVFVLR